MGNKKKVAVMADIHGNYIALTKCVDYALAQGAERFFFLGDYLGELAYPERAMNMLYDMRDSYECCFIRGNKEDYWLHYRQRGETGWRPDSSHRL